jgi:acyl carrier protein
MSEQPGTDGARPLATREAAEAALQALFASVLQVPSVSTDDDFFALGGESVHVVTLISEIATTLGVEVPLSSVFDYSTVADLAEYLTASSRRGRAN